MIAFIPILALLCKCFVRPLPGASIAAPTGTHIGIEAPAAVLDGTARFRC